jgi:hypothetical protein
VDLAAGINERLSAMANAMNGIIQHAFYVGALLNRAKAMEGHGDWGQWLKANCNLQERTAQRYMELAANRTVIEQKAKTKNVTVSDLTLRQARLLLTDKTKKPHDDKNSQNDDATGDDPASEIPTLRGDLVDALKKLKLSNQQKAIEEAHTTVQHLRLADLIETAS